MFTIAIGNKFFELSNHLGNVLVTVSDKKLAVPIFCDPTIDRTCVPNTIVGYYYKADVITAGDYAPFGMALVGRKYENGGKYRYGFNGKENDKDAGEGVQDYGLRIYDSRLGRFLSEDPLTKAYPWYTPYQFAGNDVIRNIDLDGGEPKPATTQSENKVETSPQSKYWYIGEIPEFKTVGKISDLPVENIPNALGNGVIRVLNIIPELWNSGVANVQNLREGTWSKQMSSELSAVGSAISSAAAYPFNTPLKQQGVDLSNTLNDPSTLSTAFSFYLTAKIPLAFASDASIVNKTYDAANMAARDAALIESMKPIARSKLTRVISSMESGGLLTMGKNGLIVPSEVAKTFGLTNGMENLAKWPLWQCAEPKALNSMLNLGVTRNSISVSTFGIKGGSSYAGNGRFAGMKFTTGRTVAPKAACDRCNKVMKGLKNRG